MSRITTISQFANMDDNGIYYLENLAARRVGSKSVLMPYYRSREIINESDSGFSNIDVRAFTQYETDETRGFAIDASQMRMWDFDLLTNAGSEVHDSATTATLLNSNFPDLYTTENNNIIWSNRNYLGYVIRGICETGSGTTSIVDEEGRNFATLGLSTSAGQNKVYNLNNSEEYTITSISTTNSTNDTLNFAAGTANSDGDYFLAFASLGADNSGNDWNFFTTTAYPQFTGQESEVNFRRQIEQFDTDYLIGNGNYIAALNVDETTWNDNFKQLPSSTQFRAMAVNQDRILVGGERNGRGRVMLWNGFGDGWLSIIETTQVPTAMAAYKSGFVYMAGARLYFTDGYSVRAVANLPDFMGLNNNPTITFNQIDVLDDKIYILSNGSQNYTRALAGCYIYEEGAGFVFVPHASSSANDLQLAPTRGIPRCLNVISGSLGPTMYTFGNGTVTGSLSNVSLIEESELQGGRAIFKLNYDQKKNISKVVLHLKRIDRRIETSSGDADDFTVDVSMATGEKPLVKRMEVVTGSSASAIIVDGSNTYTAGEAKKLIRILDGVTGGEYAYISSIANAGASNETWTLDSALSTTPTTGAYIHHYEFEDAGSYSFAKFTDVPQELSFHPTDMYDSTFFLDIRFSGNSPAFQIERIDIYG